MPQKPNSEKSKMKYAAFGDVHGTDLGNLETALARENPDVLICTSDFDQPRIVRQFMELEDSYKKSGKEVIKVPGNHDHAVLTNSDISSGTLRRQGKTIWGLHNELMDDDVALNYINKLVYGKDDTYSNNRVKIFLDKEKLGEKYSTIVIHSAYDGNLSSFPGCPDEIRDLWVRLADDYDHEKNFNAMNDKGSKVMIRGHDHRAEYTYNDPEKGVVSYLPGEDGSTFRLFEKRQHTVTHGALFDGFFITIDTEVPGEDEPILRYHNLNFNLDN